MSDPDRNASRTAADLEAVDAAPASAPRQRTLSRRTLIVVVLAAVTCLAAVVFALEVFVAERIPELTSERLAAAHELWQRQGPASYDIDVQIEGERPGPVHVEVRNGEVVAMTRDDRAPDQRIWHYWAVPGQFDTLEQELVLAKDPVHEVDAKAGTVWRVRCEFDPQLGFPRRYQRTVFGGGGPDLYWRVTNFAVR